MTTARKRNNGKDSDGLRDTAVEEDEKASDTASAKPRRGRPIETEAEAKRLPDPSTRSSEAAPAKRRRGRPSKKPGRGNGGGPKTAKGKARSALNALKHGILAQSPVISRIEREEDWLDHLSGIIESVDPESHLETVLAKRVAELLLRLSRVPLYEKGVSQRALAFDEGTVDDDGNQQRQPDPSVPLTTHAVDDVLPSNFHLDKIMRYESMLHRQLIQTINVLEVCQLRRQGKPVPAVNRLDIASSPSYRNTRKPSLGDALNT